MKILLIGYFGFGNLGDEAALEAFIENVKGVECEVLRLSGRLGASFSDLSRLNGERNYRAAIFVGGNLLQNETSHRSLYFYLSLINILNRKGVPIYFVSSGIGPICGYIDRKRTQKALQRVKFFGARTLSDIEKLPQGTPVKIMPDLAFFKSAPSPPRQKLAVYIPKDESTFGVFLRVCKALSLMPIILPIFYEKDMPLARRLSKIHHTGIFIPRGYEALINFMSTAEICVSERLHGAIFALNGKTPLLLSDKEEKCRDLYREVKRREDIYGVSLPVYLPKTLPPAFLLKQELGAKSSEFEIVLNSFKSDLQIGFNDFINALGVD